MIDLLRDVVRQCVEQGMQPAFILFVVIPNASLMVIFFFSSRSRHTSWPRDWSSDVCSSDLGGDEQRGRQGGNPQPGAGLPLGIGGQPIGDAGLGDEAARGGLHVEVVQAKEADLALNLEVDVLERGHLLAAGATP